MNTSGSLFGHLGRGGIILAGVVAIWWLITRYGALIGIGSRSEQILTLMVLCLTVTFIRYLPAIKKYAQELAYRRKLRRDSGIPDDELRLIKTPPHNVMVGEIRQVLRHQYGRLWRRKIRILLITGHVSDVERLTPGLTEQYWQEDQGTLLLWGGDPTQPEDRAWLTALRRLRHRSADGIVLVTSVLNGETSALAGEDALNSLSRGISARSASLGWKLPLYVWSLHQSMGDVVRISQPVGCLLPAGCRPDRLAAKLQAMVPGLVNRGIQQICAAPQHHFLLLLAERLTHHLTCLTDPLATLLKPYRSLPLAGVVFSPVTVAEARSVKHHWDMDNRWEVLPDRVHTLPAKLRPSRPGFRWRWALAVTVVMLMLLWGGAMTVSFMANRSLITEVEDQVRQVQDGSMSLSERLLALVGIQKTLARLQYREAHGVPWYLHAGLSQNAELLAAVSPRYAQSALPLLRDAAVAHLKQRLEVFVQLPPDSSRRNLLAKVAYDQLKLYLMLAHPLKMDPAWFSRTMMQNWPQRDGVEPGIWQANGPLLLWFYGAQSVIHPQWPLMASEDLVSRSRTLLVRQMGVTNSEPRQYQRVLSKVKHQYADMRLTDMTGDTGAGRLFTTDEVVPGMFTRQAWEDGVKPAIEKVARERREEMDWVLSDAPPPASDAASPEALEARLISRYFADYSAAWLNFLNSLRLEPVLTLSDAIDQLTLMADVRQSPLVALMNTLNVQGRTAQQGHAIGDSLVKSAQHLFNREMLPAIDQSIGPRGPLDATFGPLLALTDSQDSSNMSLRTFLMRVTQVRLRLQQVTNATDPQAMTQTLAQTVFQGKTVDLTETRDYGSLIAAGLGQEWSGFGQTVFVRPMEQAWQQVLMPAAVSLNVQWQQAVVNEWNSAFGGRYPFKNVSSEVSLPLLAKYLNADNGRITHFLHSRLSGVLHREGSSWVPDSINAQGLTFNPAFLQALNQLSRISDVVFTNGEAGLHFELRPGTAADVMQTDLIIDSQKLTYMNQQPVWRRFTWPADTEAPGASLSWVSTKSGTRQYGDMPGSWGLIRLLDKAHVTPNPGISSSWQLTWQAPDGRPLNYIMRTEAGEGPLALLKLRNFTLPVDIFIISHVPDTTGDSYTSEED